MAAKIAGFSARPQQQEMAERVAETLADGGLLACEAGTGVGKTFAYLVPALMSGKKTIVSTGTRALQDQLFHRDLPVVREVLGLPVTVALLKGRSNYLCLQRLEQNATRAGGRSRRMQNELVAIMAWRHRTRDGDIAELDEVSEASRVWPLVTSTTDNCLGQECPWFDDCHVLKARQRALKADLLVVNHHLFLADLALREEGFGEVLPGAEVVIFDEAHGLYDTASRFFSLSVSAGQLVELARDTIAAQLTEAGDMPVLAESAEALERAVKVCRAVLGDRQGRGSWEELSGLSAFRDALGDLASQADGLHEQLDLAAQRGPQLGQCLRRCEDMCQRLGEFLNGATQPAAQAPESQSPGETVKWFEVSARSFTLHITPLDIAAQFSGHRSERKCAWVFTSATLAVGDDFSCFTHRLGLDSAEVLRLGSPFDYPNQAVLYLPPLDTDPRSQDYATHMVDSIVPVLEASGGRAFVLFTSYRALHQAAELIAKRVSFPLLVQGQAPKAELLRRFCDTTGSVLLGTSSFWQGVDVRGDALSCVVIDKLPFAPPTTR